MKSLRRTIDFLFFLFIFLLPWQTKLILRSAETNFNEISLYASHIILIILLVLFLIHRAKTRKPSNKIPWLWYLLAGLEIFALISCFLAPDKMLVLYRFLVLLVALGIFYIIRDDIRIRRLGNSALNKLEVIYVFLISVFIQALFGIYQFLSQSTFTSKFLGLAGHRPETLGASVIETISGRWLRAYGGFDHPNIFGGVLVIALIIAASLLVKKQVLRSQRQISESLYLFIFYFVSLFALFFTFSRSSWIAFVAGMLVLLIVFIIKRDRWLIGRFVALMIFSFILITTAAIPYADLLETRINPDARLEQKSIEERVEGYSQAQGLLDNSFFFGVGLGNYTQELSIQDQYQQPAWRYQPVHNSFLLLLVETGVFTLLFFLAFLLYLVIKKDHPEDFTWAVFVAFIILLILDHWLLSLPFGVLFLFLVLGLI